MNNKEAVINKRSNQRFPFYRFKGTHHEIGLQHGEACRGLIERHLNLAVERLQRQHDIALPEILEETLKYRKYVKEHSPFLDDEIVGIAKGANISIEEAYLLQVRAEINRCFKTENECTTFAVAPESTKEGTIIIGQNADLPEFYSSISIIKEVEPEDGKATLMLTPAGQVSYIGINNAGMGVFANFLECEGWREGYPRYMFSRFALTHDSIEEAVKGLRSLTRASSRNLIMSDKNGVIANMETTVTDDALLKPKDGILAHANHYLSNELANEERSKGYLLNNSKIRQQRMEQLLLEKKGEITVEILKEIMRDRENYPNCLCQAPGDESMQAPGDSGGDIVTFASVIAEPEAGRMWVAMGPPNEYEYHPYSFTR
ncbi:acyl-CoA--6-aminopenicillanic acid acyl-transferase [Siminovitchia terrae]|uniref:Acyl-CoA--6-aminopenicillanic acid acyl-transferase n=1 Tax=Siminovitchia terrae TaxID=1914933 RepID=A0ABQ4KUE2_SIMTE|nr:C45 family peptidase [Siminovitchia terrae]GIN95665.1 acyl-CoA--6-aminopenicillanic acid acyl-transferase [Siminovitchia terrae]